MAMKITCRWKLGIVVTCVAVSLTSLCVYAVYRTGYKEIMAQITKNMVHLGHLGGSMLDEEARAAIRRLNEASKKASIVTKAEIDAMPLQSTLSSLKQEDIDSLQASSDFKKLVKSLVMIATASHQDMEPPKEIYRIDEP